MANIHSFAASYSEARDKFLSAARIANAKTMRGTGMLWHHLFFDA